MISSRQSLDSETVERPALKSEHRRSAIRTAVIASLLVLATAHCVLSIFYTNYSFIDLAAYANGHERMPFQGRLLMSLVLRATQHLQTLLKLVPRFTEHVPALETFTVYKLTSLIVALISAIGIGAALALASRRLGLRRWWLPWSLLLVILYSSYAARYEQPLWYPYDIPHLAIFGLATIFLFIDAPIAFLGAILLDSFVRETAIFAIVLAFAMRWSQRTWKIVLVIAAIGWAVVMGATRYIYRANGYVGMPRLEQLRYLLPWHLPQLFSVLAFLPIPVLLGRRYLPAMHRRGLYATCLMILGTFYFANWVESRAWIEWSTAFAIWAALELSTAPLQPGASIRS
ncbi:MAG TPA: hypothetical protein VGU25_05125 [Acidobacteriaceae bacterium]|nr:hypothetical protein [Acidobacteriaceae bacterium]